MLSAMNDRAKKTHIMYRANLSYELLVKYLDFLVFSYLARFEQREGRYVLTAKGEEFLDQYRAYLDRNEHVKKHINDIDARRKALEDLCSGNQESCV
jgi:predicted transcriptional regulator